MLWDYFTDPAWGVHSVAYVGVSVILLSLTYKGAA
jgi:hypothetical protein